MARPRSQDKRRAILDAALQVFAERGISDAPTSAISKAAGVAEGSLFTYFKTKNDLMNELYLELRSEFSRYLTEFPLKGDARARLRYIWDKYLELAAMHPERLNVLAQLRASGKLFKENEPPQFAILEVLNAAREAASKNELRDAPPDFLVLMLRAQVEATVQYIEANPERRAACTEHGFRMLWNSLSGNKS